MKRRRNPIVQGVFLALLFVLGSSGFSRGAEFWLRAETFTKTMPDATAIPMWGFAQCTDGTFASCTPPSVPGPRLTVPVGDSTLTINLRNSLAGPLAEPVSLVIPGQAIVPTPVRNPDGRARAFTAETAVGATRAYTWNNFKPGTYLYESGSHPAVQVQMGLYGAATKDTAAGQAYGPTTAYNAEAMLFFSEIDPALHGHVNAGTYGTAAYPSTFNYEPKYFLINGEPYWAGATAIPAGQAGNNLLVRFLSASLKQRVPTLNGLTMSLVAEDGNVYAHPKEQYSLLLPPGKTQDAVITASQGVYAVYDRRLGLTNGAAPSGGMLAYLNVGTNPATMVSPANGATLAGTSQNFTWTDAGAELYDLWIGTAAGTYNVFEQSGTGTSANATGLPANGSAVYVRLWSRFGGTWLFNDYTYTASGTPPITTAPTMTSPANGSILAGTSQTFTWTNVGADLYDLWIGTVPGAYNVFEQPGTGTSVNAIGLPVNGGTLYVRVWARFGATWVYNDYTYTASGTPPVPTAPTMTSPANGSTLAGTSQTFTWTNVGADLYDLWVGTVPGAYNVFEQPGTGTSVNAIGLPANGGTLYVRVWARFGATWVYNDYTYTASGTPPVPTAPTMTSPANGSTLAGTSQTFTWTNVGADLYDLWVGTSAGTYNVFEQPGTGTSVNATGLPANGSTVYVRVWGRFSGTWYFNDYTYTASGP